MNIRTFLRLAVVTLLSLFIVACKPTANFTYSPKDVYVNTAVTFDASSSNVENPEKGNVITAYAWDFGDNTKATDKIAVHTYTKVGSYKVSLTITDKTGGQGTTSQTVVVKDIPGKSVNLNLSVTSADGALLKGVTITTLPATSSLTTDINGSATINTTLPKDVNEYVIKASLSGFVTQSLRLKAEQTAATIIMLPLKEVTAISDVTKAQNLQSAINTTSVALDAGSIVTSAGAAAKGAATSVLTPWYIQGVDLNATPGNGVIKTSSGEMGTLASAGIAAFRLFDSSGNALNLASGKTATLTSDLATLTLNNQPISVGTQIPLWLYDEAQGIWVEKGIGNVVSSSTSPVGLAVKSAVPSTGIWSWGYKSSNNSTFNIKCTNTSGTASDCQVLAQMIALDGTRIAQSIFTPASGATINNAPANGKIILSARQGDLTNIPVISEVSAGSANLSLLPAQFSNTVQCQLSDKYSVGCEVSMNILFKDNTTATKVISVGANGGKFISNAAVSTIAYKAVSTPITTSGVWTRYTGALDATASTTPVITLPTAVKAQ